MHGNYCLLKVGKKRRGRLSNVVRICHKAQEQKLLMGFGERAILNSQWHNIQKEAHAFWLYEIIYSPTVRLVLNYGWESSSTQNAPKKRHPNVVLLIHDMLPISPYLQSIASLSGVKIVISKWEHTTLMLVIIVSMVPIKFKTYKWMTLSYEL